MKFRAIVAGCVLAAVFAANASAQQRGGVINVAIASEPPTLDVMSTTASITAIVGQHIFETLYALDKDANAVPLIAVGEPEVSDEGRTNTIALRRDVKFHNGAAMTSKDVVVSLNRWLKVSTTGRQMVRLVESISAKDDYTIVIKLKQPLAPLTQYLASHVAMGAIYPADHLEDQNKTPIGTGPYQVKERRADRYIQLTRFDGYTNNKGEPNGWAGARTQAADEIRFMPVVDPSTRLEGALAGQFDYVDALPTEAYERLKDKPEIEARRILYGWPFITMTQQHKPFENVKMRQAVLAALDMDDIMSGYGKEFYQIDGALYPKPSRWNTSAGIENYNKPDPARAAKLLKEAGYDGTPIRFMASRYNEDQFRLSQVTVEYLKAAGFNVDFQVMDWATLNQRRVKPDTYDMYVTAYLFYPDPALIGGFSEGSSSGWKTPARDAALLAFNTELDPKKRMERWAELQALVYTEVPFIKFGNIYSLVAVKKDVKGIPDRTYPYFWNAYRAN